MAEQAPDRRALTLVELLVVISIVALLLAVLLPVFGQSRDVARAVACLSNVRQLSAVNMAYANDNQDFYVRTANRAGANLERWHGKRTNPWTAFESSESDLASYFGHDAQVQHCPTFEYGRDYQPGFEDGAGGYGYSNHLGARADLFLALGGAAYTPSSHYSARQSDVVSPVETVMFTDSAFIAAADPYVFFAYSACEAPYWIGGNGLMADPTIHFRHQERTNVAWADGHADSQEMSFSRGYSTWSLVTGDEATQQQVGWFGPQDNSLFDLE